MANEPLKETDSGSGREPPDHCIPDALVDRFRHRGEAREVSAGCPQEGGGEATREVDGEANQETGRAPERFPHPRA